MRRKTEVIEYHGSFGNYETNCCYYCGQPATTIDHVPPRSIRATLLDQGEKAKFFEVDACHECNIGLGNCALWTLEERGSFIKKWLKQRYKKLLKMPSWSERELEELAPLMQKRVRAVLEQRDIIKQRLSWRRT